MDKRKSLEPFDALANAMRREAWLTRPKFSPPLHTRLCEAVHSVAPLESRAAVAGRHPVRRRLVSWAVVAAASIAVLVGSARLWHAARSPSPQTTAYIPPVEEAQPADDDIHAVTAPLENMATEAGQWVQEAADDNQWAGLDRHATTVVASISDSLPFDVSGDVAAADAKQE